jgi:ketosteroid isomerase-like protein
MKAASVVAIALAVGLNCCIPSWGAASNAKQVEQNKHTASMWFEDTVVKQDRSGLDKILADDVILELPPSMTSYNGSNKVVGKPQVIKHAEDMNKKWTVTNESVEMIGEGNKVAVWRMVTSTIDGKTSKGVPWASIFEFDDNGKIKHVTHVSDTMHHLNQVKAQLK